MGRRTWGELEIQVLPPLQNQDDFLNRAGGKNLDRTSEGNHPNYLVPDYLVPERKKTGT